MKKQSGISLAEVLVSLFLSSLIMTILVHSYLSSKRQYVEAEEILSTGFDLRWVSDLLSDSIRRAGFTPCLGLDQLNIKDRRPNGKVIHGLKIENYPHQLIQINRINEHFDKVVNIQSPTQILVSHPALFHEKHPLLIADCEHAEVAQIFSREGALITLNSPLQFSYTASAYIGEFLEERWFIKKNIKGEESLHYQLIQTEEITPLVHSLKIHKQKVHGRQFIKISMGLAEGKTYKLRVAVRGS